MTYSFPIKLQHSEVDVYIILKLIKSVTLWMMLNIQKAVCKTLVCYGVEIYLELRT